MTVVTRKGHEYSTRSLRADWICMCIVCWCKKYILRFAGECLDKSHERVSIAQTSKIPLVNVSIIRVIAHNRANGLFSLWTSRESFHLNGVTTVRLVSWIMVFGIATGVAESVMRKMSASWQLVFYYLQLSDISFFHLFTFFSVRALRSLRFGFHSIYFDWLYISANFRYRFKRG